VGRKVEFYRKHKSEKNLGCFDRVRQEHFQPGNVIDAEIGGG
jgi:hypothetical protein